MLKQALLFEAALITCMVGTSLRPAPPPPQLSTGEGSFCIQEEPPLPPTTMLTVAPVAALPKPPAPVVVAPPPPVKIGDDEPALYFPVEGLSPEAIISVFGDKRGAHRLHKGIDISAPRGTAVVAVAAGTVERRREGGIGGRQLYLRDAAGRLYYYAHLDDWAVEEGQTVAAGEVLGTVGNTGNARSTLPHLHFEVLIGKKRQAVDPQQFWIRP
ncbi:murein DD-endopeptidase MepM/ murein hydrolase activator NlpD [Lewinella marina]|uniref:Endopeptidase n=1 Tax=Neolewinella marina TaxID=438751 RepID=A0A2G0CGA0_9BACT|nr:M23 family metallopeptidase [Neolewinella marina]NJB86531.1 murein DD-endopeptidase MepM/ murein hydrolase activator NlpD [Neolewinella marina]PHK99015.1 endopeptidase [Neolewinella marina]